MSPDGAYWWDGQAWQPVQKAGPQVPPGPNVQDLPRWARPAKPSSPHSTMAIAAVVAIAVMLVGGGLWAWQNMRSDNAPPPSTPSAAQVETVPPNLNAVLDKGLAGNFAGEYCSVLHEGDSACFKVSFTNRGPAIGRLAIILRVGKPYADWIAIHPHAMLATSMTTQGCTLDATNSAIVCGPVAPKGEVAAYLQGIVQGTGTFKYAVAFADISSGKPVFLNQRIDGGYQVLTYTETIH
jgi:hypothetical protein